jgi:hypothetical protein
MVLSKDNNIMGGEKSSPLFFMVTKILTTKSRTDRLITSLKLLRDVDIHPTVFYAIEDDIPKISFNKSMKHLMDSCDETLLLFEDDVELKSINHFEEAISQLPSDWELCYLGANLVDGVERYSNNLFKTFGAWTTHAVMYNNPKKLCEQYSDYDIMFDDWLRTNIHPNGKSFIISPMIAWQKPSQSDLWNHYADYNDIFNGSANKLL